MFNADILEFTAVREEFKELGAYTKAYPGTRSYKLFWDEQIRRSLEGYHTGRDYIPGYFYFYLNFGRIEKVIYDKTSKIELGKSIRGIKVNDFPDFHDGDYTYFHYLEEAEKEGLHGAVAKGRRKGYSFKGAAMLNRNYFLVPGSKNYVYAESKEYLIKDGILTKTWDMMSFIDQHTAWSKRRQYKDTDLHKRASYQSREHGKVSEKGYKSEIIGVVIDDPNKVRGKAGKLILWEEAGNMRHLLQGWQIARPSVEQGKATFGLMVAFGTGGSAEEAAYGLEQMFYDPESYRIKSVYNEWEEGMEDTKCALFVPSYMNMEGYMDDFGNSDKEGAKLELLNSRETLKKGRGTAASLGQKMAEEPITPSEAFLRTSSNIFPVAELANWEKIVANRPEYKGYGTPGELYHDQTIKFKPSDAEPIYEFPIKKNEDKKGTVVLYYPPYRKEGVTPDNLYYICHDPYAQDGEGNSLGAAYVLVRPNPYTTPDDCIVASYVGRPDSMDEYNRNLFMLAEYFNAKIGFENDRGDIMGYAKRFRKLEWLQEEFTMPDNKELQSRSTSRRYGMHMTESRKRTGEVYLRDWLLEERTVDVNGNKLLNLHYIYDIGLLKELQKYDSRANFDRVSSLIVGMFFNRELYHKKIKEIRQEEDKDSFFNRNYKS